MADGKHKAGDKRHEQMNESFLRHRFLAYLVPLVPSGPVVVYLMVPVSLAVTDLVLLLAEATFGLLFLLLFLLECSCLGRIPLFIIDDYRCSLAEVAGSNRCCCR